MQIAQTSLLPMATGGKHPKMSGNLWKSLVLCSFYAIQVFKQEPFRAEAQTLPCDQISKRDLPFLCATSVFSVSLM